MLCLKTAHLPWNFIWNTVIRMDCASAPGKYMEFSTRAFLLFLPVHQAPLRLFWELPTILFGQYWTIYTHQETQRNLCPGGLLVWGCDVIKGSWDLMSNWKIRSPNSSKRAHLFWMQSTGLSMNDWVNHSYFWSHPPYFSSEMHVQTMRLSRDIERLLQCIQQLQVLFRWELKLAQIPEAVNHWPCGASVAALNHFVY